METADQGLTERARAFALASVLTSYPDEELEHVLSSNPPMPAASGVARVIADGGLDELRATYLDLFDRGKERASLYETEYGRMRGMAKGNDLADIAGFYRAFGLVVDGERMHEMPDHIAVELEFYAVLLLKQRALDEIGDEDGRSIVEDARRRFLTDHLGGLVRAIGDRGDAIEHPAYGPVFAWCCELVEAECASLGVDPPALDFHSDEELRRGHDCGHVRLPVVES